MNAIEIKGLSKNFRTKQAVCGLEMTVPQGAIYGFIGENGSGKSTTEKMICGLLVPSGGSIKLFDKDYTDADIRAKVGVLIESPGCFPNMSVWQNMKLQAANLGMKHAQTDIVKVLKMVRMEGAAGNKYKNCSLGMKQRIGIAMALLGSPELLVLEMAWMQTVCVLCVRCFATLQKITVSLSLFPLTFSVSLKRSQHITALSVAAR